MNKILCPREYCGGWLYFEIGYIAFKGGNTSRVNGEDRVVCMLCGRYRYLVEASSGVPKGRPDGLPFEVVRSVAPSEAIKRAKKFTRRG